MGSRRYDSLILLIHGIESPLPGTGRTMQSVAQALMDQASLRRAFILESSVLKGSTLLGVEHMADMVLSRELRPTLEQPHFGDRGEEDDGDMPPVKFFIIGHSLGGIVARYLCYLLLKTNWLAGRLVPVSFMTIGSPHLGVVRSSNLLGLAAETVGAALFGGSVTLRQLMFRDKREDGVPLLVRMSTGEYLDALAAFRVRTLVSAIQWDHQVTFCSSSITLFNQYDTRWHTMRYLMSWLSSNYHDRLVGYSGFDRDGDEYDLLLQYHGSSKKRQNASVRLEAKDGEVTTLVTTEKHAKRYTSHPHLADDGDLEIASEDASVVAAARGLQTLHWRRIDFELMSLFPHDVLVNHPVIELCGLIRSPTPYGRKIVNKLAKVIALDALLHGGE